MGRLSTHFRENCFKSEGVPTLATQRNLEIQTNAKESFIDITGSINDIISSIGADQGLCHIYIPHTTAGVTVNEGADPCVVEDILAHLHKAIPQTNVYTHAEGNSPAHIKSLVTGNQTTIPFYNKKMLLGTWQKVFFCEFDGPRRRKMIITVVSG